MSRTPDPSDILWDRTIASLRNARYLQPEGKSGMPPGVRNMLEMTALGIFGLGSVWAYLAGMGPIGKALIAVSIVLAPLIRVWAWWGNRDETRAPARTAEMPGHVDRSASADDADFDPDAIMARYVATRDAALAAAPPQPAVPTARRAFGRKPA